MSVTAHEAKNCYTVEFDLRDFPPVQPFAIRVNWPNVIRDNGLDPSKLKTTQFTAKYTNDTLLNLLATKPYSTTELQKELKKEAGMAPGTFYTLWAEVKKLPGVEQDADDKWTYSAPAANCANN